MIIGIDASRATVTEKTGVETYAYRIIEELKKTLPANVRVILYTREALSGSLAVLPGNWESKVLAWPPKRLWTQVRLSVEMLLHSPDVLFVPAHVVPFIHPQKTVMTVHDVAASAFPETYNWFERWYSVWSAKRAVRKLWRVIVPSAFTRDAVNVYAENNSVRVVSLGIDHQLFCREKKSETEKISAIKNRYGIIHPYMLTIGRLEEKKNTERLIKAFDELRRLEPGSTRQLVLAGKPGFGYEKIAQAIKDSPYTSHIIETGWIGENDLPYLLAGARLFVFPSLYEGFGLPVLEAMAIGVPVIASRGTSLEEVGGDAAMYVDPKHTHELSKKMQMILTNQSLSDLLIKNGYGQAARFSWELAGRKTAQILCGE